MRKWPSKFRINLSPDLNILINSFGIYLWVTEHGRIRMLRYLAQTIAKHSKQFYMVSFTFQQTRITILVQHQ